jgi:hypothetical protein
VFIPEQRAMVATTSRKKSSESLHTSTVYSIMFKCFRKKKLSGSIMK